MKQYKIVNNLFGWLAFAIAAFTYCMTVEPTASFWDCPEFITTAYKLEVGHPPGAPFFMLTANFFTQFTSDPSKVALCVNTMSALLSATCILFLFWTITHLTRKLICKDGVVTSLRQTLLIMAAGLTGALAYTWSDTFWFSAVEAEVYAFSSLCTALVFWLILKWEERAESPAGDRLLMLVAYVMGLSIGVHLLNLLCIPALVTVIYYRRAKTVNIKGLAVATALSIVLLMAVLYGLIPGMPVMAQYVELLSVNLFGWTVNSGSAAYTLLLLALFAGAIWAIVKCHSRWPMIALTVSAVALSGLTMFGGNVWVWLAGVAVIAILLTILRPSRRRLLTGVTSLMLLFVGYSSYGVVLMRSAAGTPVNEGAPSDLFSLSAYLARDQYGKAPLFYGDTPYSKPVSEIRMVTDDNGRRTAVSSPIVSYDTIYALGDNGRYERVADYTSATYNAPDELKMIMPRIHSPQHIVGYTAWISAFSDSVDAVETVCSPELADTLKNLLGTDVEEDLGMVPGTFDGRDMLIRYKRLPKPSQADNFRFMLNYQFGHMYWRYFLWNFAGRQNDLLNENAEHTAGNWLTGFPLLDNYRLGDQNILPAEKGHDNPGHNVYYCIPLLLGYAGLLLQLLSGRRGRRQAWVVTLLFLMTGLAIVVYLNQTPTEPRERDYAFAGSFYAYAIWVGLGILGLWTLACHYLRGRKARVAVTAVCGAVAVAVPLQVVSQTWDDHDRSGRTVAVDMARNYLESLEPYAIIFTFGDNDTFPLWYAQETEGQRTDARVCNLSYLQTDWYTDQMRRQAYKSAPLPIAWSRYEYVDNRGEGFDAYDVKPEMRKELDEIKRKTGVNTYDLKYIIDHYVRGRVANDQPGVVPTDSVVVPVNKAAVINSGMTLPYGKDSIPDYITISLKGKSRISKSRMMVYEMLARNDWQRPMYMSLTLGGPGSENYAGLDEYLVLEGLAYRITPFRHPRNSDGSFALTVDSDKMYHNLMHRYKYGNVNKPGIYLDETVRRMCSTHRSMFTILARQLLKEDKKDKALEVLRKCKEMLPPENIPYDENDIELADFWLRAGDSKEAVRIARTIGNRGAATLRWISTVSDRRMDMMHGTIAAAFDALTQAYRILGAADQKAAKQFETTLLGLQNTRAYQLVESWYAQPSEPAPAVPFNMGGLGSDGLGGTGAGFSGMN